MTIPKLLAAAAISWVASMSAPCRAEPPPVARLTIVDGDATLIRAASRYAAPNGLALAAGDIIESTKSAHLVRIEFADKAIVDLGPRTRVLLRPALPTRAASVRPLVYALSGWIKLTPPPAAQAAVVAPSIEVLTSGAVVLHMEPQEVSVFAESGEGVVSARGELAAEGGPVLFKAGQYVSAADGAPPRLARQAPSAWIQGVPAALRDRLPSRLDQFTDAKVALKGPRALTPTDVDAWLAAEPALRQGLRTRWDALAREADARDAAARGLRPAPEAEHVQAVSKTASPAAASPLPSLAPARAPATVLAASMASPAIASAAQGNPLERFDTATFAAADKSVQGRAIALVAYSERAGEAAHAPLAVRNGELLVRGEFVEKGQSAWAGVGVSVNLYAGPTDASAFKTLRIRLGAAAGVGSLRVRIVGADKQALKSGCYPVFQQAVTPQVRTYDIPLNRFVPEGFCGNAGIPAADTLGALVGLEVADTVRPFVSRAVNFNVGTVSLMK